MQAKNIVIAVVALALVGAVVFLFINSGKDTVVILDQPSDDSSSEGLPTDQIGELEEDSLTSPEPVTQSRGDMTTIGQSVSGTAINAYHFGTGEQEILLVGGVHGGYSPNTSRLAQEFVTYFSENESVVPDTLMVTIIPNLNPDGTQKSGAAGRFNTNEVDLNRNFDCEWSATGVWQTRQVSGGSAPFSEPEATALRDYIEKYSPTAAVVWFSAEGKVYPSACAGAPSRDSITLAATFASAAGYPTEAEFDAYAITGDMVNWMAKEGIPAISVLLSDHQDTEWAKNEAGIKAILNTYAE